MYKDNIKWPFSILTTCLEEIKAWMKQNVLQLNSSKTEAILIGTPTQLKTSVINSIAFSGQDILLSTSVTNLGVKMDSHLTFEDHIKHLCTTSFIHLRNIAKLRPMLTFGDAESLSTACLLQAGLLYCAPHRDPWQKPPEAAVHSEQCC